MWHSRSPQAPESATRPIGDGAKSATVGSMPQGFRLVPSAAALALIAAALFSCTLNPQPEPPAEGSFSPAGSGGSHNALPDAATDAPHNGEGGLPGAGGASGTGGEEVGGSSGAAGCAGESNLVDAQAPSDAAGDASDDAQHDADQDALDDCTTSDVDQDVDGAPQTDADPIDGSIEDALSSQ